jgi:hypothetical protein
MRRNIIAACLALATLAGAVTVDEYSSPEWKEEIAKGFLPYRKLTMDDFPVDDQVSSSHWMHTEGFFHYEYKASWTESRGEATAKITQLTVRSGFNQKKSWKRGSVSTDVLLEHEQGHLDISELHANAIRFLSPMPVGRGYTGQAAMDDLKAKLKAVCDKNIRDSQAEQDRYDTETNHGADKAKQKIWSAGLRRQLDEARITYWDKAG